VKPLEAYPAVKAAAEKAIALDEHEAEAHAYLGEAVRVLDWDYHAEELELHRAIALDPNCAPAHLFLALLLSSRAADDEAWRELAAAKRLDPLSPIVSNFIVELCLSTKRLDDAVAEAQRLITLDPSYSYFDDSLAAAERERGRLNESIALYENAAIATQQPRPGLAIAYARAGRIDAARDVLARLLQQAQTRYIAADGIASIYVALGENDEAFRWLDRAVHEHAAPLEGIGRRVVFRPLHSDARFPALLRKINLDPTKLLPAEKQP
jgi:tetratricopeptide (TPR) repeat protein